MKKTGKFLIYFIIIVIFLVTGLLSYVKFALPNIGDAPEINVEITKERVARGKYLANHVTVCIDCHSQRNWTIFSGPIDTNNIGTGGEKFDHSVGFPGEVYVPNITPFNLQKWSDGEIFRAITSGVKKDGSAIFPIMPYQSYAKMAKEDIYSIIAYIRTLPAKESPLNPERKLDFPLNFLVNTMPIKAENINTVPNKKDSVSYGAYLVRSAACKDCHTNQIKGEFVEGMEFAGGREFGMPGATLLSANITPDKESGIGNWTREVFISRFKSYSDNHNLTKINKAEFQTIMPWSMYGKMKTEDLSAIYSYLRSLKPIKNKVNKFIPQIAQN